MPNSAPIVGWYEDSLATSDEVTQVINYGTVEAGTDSGTKKFFIINNRNGEVDVPKMENVVFTTRDRQGGVGDTPNQEVEAVRDNWFMIRVDSLQESNFNPVGKDHDKAIGTNGSTTSRFADIATTWTPNTQYTIGQFVEPTTGGDFIYQVKIEGESDGSEPAWANTDNADTVDGTITWRSYRIVQTPATQELLGLANKIDDNGSNATNAAGNFAEVTVYAEVPPTASSGINRLLFRVTYQFS